METPAQTPSAAELRAFLARLEGFADLVKAVRDGVTADVQAGLGGAPSAITDDPSAA